jgi:hypothetical protein
MVGVALPITQSFPAVAIIRVRPDLEGRRCRGEDVSGLEAMLERGDRCQDQSWHMRRDGCGGADNI